MDSRRNTPREKKIFAPKFAYGLVLRPWISLLYRKRSSLALRHIPAILLGTMIVLTTSSYNLLSNLIFARRIGDTKIDPAPLFVLGHWRSGTTYLHELLAADGRHAYPSGYQCYVPGNFLLTERLIKPIVGFFIPKKRPMDDMDLGVDRPQEEEFALLNLTGRSNYAWSIFPAGGPVDFDYISLRRLDTDARAEWIDIWMDFLKAVKLGAGPDKRLILKSPNHTARIRTILQLFPKAKFVHIARNPIEICDSTLRTWRAVAEMNGPDHVAAIEPWLEESVLKTFEEIYTCYEEDRTLIPDSNLHELSYEDLIRDPKAALAEIYKALDLGEFAPAEPAIDKRLAESPDYKPKTKYQASPNALKVSRRWSDYIERFGYADEVSRVLAAHQAVDQAAE